MSFGELAIEPLYNASRDIKAHDLVEYQLVRRDISLVCQDTTTWADIRTALQAHPKLRATEFRSEYADDALRKTRCKNLVVRVLLDLGANPAGDDIQVTMNEVTRLLTDSKALGKVTIN